MGHDLERLGRVLERIGHRVCGTATGDLAATRRARRGPEARLLAAITRALHRLGYQVERQAVGAYRIHGRWIRYGIPGQPDLLIRKSGCPDIYLEVKTARGRLSPAQRHRHAQLRRLGATVYVVRSVEEAVAAVTGRRRA